MLHIRIIAAAVVLAGLTIAFPTANSGSCPAMQQIANFDDIPAPPLAFDPAVPTPYKGLFFQSFGVANQSVQAVGVVAHSPPNLAFTNAVQETSAGTSMITVNYPNSKVVSFSLQSFYFSCTQTLENGATQVPIACNINFAGYRGNDNQVSNAVQVAAQQFQYNPSTSTGLQQMALGQFWGFSDIQFAIVTFSEVGGSALLNPDLGLEIDSVSFSTKSC